MAPGTPSTGTPAGPTTEAGVLGVGAATGSLRLAAAEVAAAWGRSGGRTTAAVCGPDEDPLTLAWSAATAALTAAGVDPGAVGGCWWACSRPPFAEGPSLPILTASVGLSASVVGALVGGSPHAGVDALIAAAHALAAGAVDVALVVQSDALLPSLGSGFEPVAGAGAAAIVLVKPGRPAAALLSIGPARSRPVLDRYRGDGETHTRDLYDSRLFREEVFLPAVRQAADAISGGDPRSVPRWSLPDPDGRLGRTAARAIGADHLVSAEVTPAIGDSGAAAALLGLLPALLEPGAAGAVAYGGGRATGVRIDVTEPVPGAAAALGALAGGRPASYAEALRARGQLRPGGEQVPMGVPPGSAMFVRETEAILQLRGARCDECGTVVTPPAIHPACIACGGPKLSEVSLARHGTVHTYVINHTMPAPFEAPLPLLVVDLDDGARLMVQGTGTGSDVAVDSPVQLVLRRYAVERGVPVYGYKAEVTPSERTITRGKEAG